MFFVEEKALSNVCVYNTFPARTRTRSIEYFPEVCSSRSQSLPSRVTEHIVPQ